MTRSAALPPRYALAERLREIAESIVDASTDEGRDLLRAADYLEMESGKCGHSTFPDSGGSYVAVPKGVQAHGDGVSAHEPAAARAQYAEAFDTFRRAVPTGDGLLRIGLADRDRACTYTENLERVAEAHGYKIVRPRWWERTYAIPRWLAWSAAPVIAYHAILGLNLIVGWLS